MALIQHSFFPRSAFNTDPFRALDLFDPFDELDMPLGNMISWLSRPMAAIPAIPRVPQKYRVTVDCTGYSPQSIKTEIVGDKLIVTGKEGELAKSPDEDHTLRSFKQTFQLPKLIAKDQMTSFMDRQGTLVIDIPYKMDDSGLTADDMLPQVVDTPDGHKAINMNMHLPAFIDPAKIHVTAKDRDIIVKAQDKTVTPNSTSTVSFYRRSTMPENADLKNLKCTATADNKLCISAPLSDHALPAAKKHAIAIDQQ